VNPKPSRNSQLPRSFVLVAVLVVITSAVLVATSMIFMAQGRAVETSGAADAAQMRALAWSGVQLVMSELNDQRERLLNSQLPRLDHQYTVYETANRAGIIRLLPMSAGGQSLFSAEAGKLDVNAARPGTLAITGMIETAAADAIVTHRDQTLKRPYQSVAELLHVPGASITPRMLYGAIEELKPRDQAQQEPTDVAQRIAARLQPDRVRGIADILTVFAAEPAAQRDGKPRINLNQPWSDDLEQQISARFGAEAAAQVKGMTERGMKFETEASIINALNGADLAPRHWPDLLDAFTTESGEFHFGRMDINTAPAAALMALPEITSTQAAQIVSVRQQLSDDEKASIVWPVIAEIISPQTLAALAGRITTRCFMYQVRIAAGEVDPDEPDGSMTNPVIVEAIIDLSAPMPRIAYLRDISVLQAAAQIALEAARNETPFDVAALPEPELEEHQSLPEEPAPASGEAAPESSNPPTGNSPGEAEPSSPVGTMSSNATGRRIGRWLNGG
jgi:DNA uptake protein ComE-like DNA-binding protein